MARLDRRVVSGVLAAARRWFVSYCGRCWGGVDVGLGDVLGVRHDARYTGDLAAVHTGDLARVAASVAQPTLADPRRRGARRPRRARGWQSFVFTALATAALAYRAIRSRRHWQQPLALGCGASIGLIASFAWIHWVYGSFTPLMANRNYRSDGSGPLATIHAQWSFLWGLMPMALLVGAVGATFAVRDARVRALFGLSAVAVIGYGLAFSGRAEIHDYWNYAALIPVAVAASAGVDHLVRTANASRRSLVVVGSLLMATACLVVSVTQPTGAQYAIENGVGTVELARVAQRLAGDDPGPVLAYGSAGGALSRWIDYETGRPGLALHSLDDLRRLAEQQPDFPVLCCAGEHERPDAAAPHGKCVRDRRAIRPSSCACCVQRPVRTDRLKEPSNL